MGLAVGVALQVMVAVWVGLLLKVTLAVRVMVSLAVAVWVRVPAIKGNARQELRMFWSNTNAKSESSGPAVFNKSNGYLSVWHMNDPVQDDAGTVESTDPDTTAIAGVIGSGRRFAGGKGKIGRAHV